MTQTEGLSLHVNLHPLPGMSWDPEEKHQPVILDNFS